MNAPRKQSLLVCGLVFAMLASLIIIVPEGAVAATFFDDTDVDFTPDGTGGLLSGTQITGTNAPAYVEIAKDFENWLQMSPPSWPQARDGAAMAYDGVNNALILFGGFNGASYLGDTWRYNPVADTWTNITPGTSPVARRDPGMVYDSGQQRIVLYGGWNGTYRTDTWEFNPSTDTWLQIITAGPGDMISQPLAYDSAAARVIMAGSPSIGTMETWAYNTATDTWVDRAPIALPPSRAGHVLVYYPTFDKTVLYGGAEVLAFFDDTWEYDYTGNFWSMTLASGPGQRTGAAAVFRPPKSDILLFGGYVFGGGYLQDTWRYNYDLGFASWDAVLTTGNPPGRSAMGMAYEPAANTIALFGGRYVSGRWNDTWQYVTGYRPGGIYRSNRFDSSSAGAIWNILMWNDTTQPPGTVLRFQLLTDNNPNAWQVASGIGPDCTGGTYYTTTPATICPTQAGRYLWYIAQLVTPDPTISPKMDNVTIDYTAPSSPPTVISHYPNHTEPNVPVGALVIVNFSEAMDTPTVTIETSPPIPFITPFTWTNGDSTATADHSLPFNECQAYWVWVNGTDLQGDPLPIPPIMGDNRFLFIAECTPPTLDVTDPAHVATDVLITAPIILYFSEGMDTGPTGATITPGVALTEGWSVGDSVLTLTHPDFAYCTWYEVNVTGQDKNAQPLEPFPASPVPNPFLFKTECPNPEVLYTLPANGEINVVITTQIEIGWSEPMNTGSVVLTPTPGLVNRVDSWNSPTNDIMYIDHDPFTACQEYVINISAAQDVGGTPMLAPYEWRFTTDCNAPIIIDTVPNDGDLGVLPNQYIEVSFSLPMNPASFTWTLNGGAWPMTETWNAPMNNVWRGDPLAPYSPCTDYTFDVVTAEDTTARPFADPLNLEPLTFSTICPNPTIVATDPVDGAINVPLTYPITVDFDRAMRNTTTVETSPPTSFTQVWTNGNMTVTASHGTPFAACTQYTVWVNGTDLFGFPLIPGPVPNPFTFSTVCASPFVVDTNPVDLSANVPLLQSIWVNFSEPMLPGSVSVESSPAMTYNLAFSNGDATVTASHGAPFAICTVYTVWVNGTDVDGNPLIGGPVPVPWTFTTSCTLAAPANLKVQRFGGGADIRLDWDDVTGATEYLVYYSSNRFAPFPGAWTLYAPNPTISEQILLGQGSDPNTYFYVVEAQAGAAVSGKSTMGVKRPLVFTLNPLNTNVMWFSLPYRSGYTKASDIANELTSANVNVVGKWNPATQRSDIYYFRGSKWRGTDFTIGAADGLYLGIVSSFTWVVNGTDSSTALSFNLNLGGNVNWRGIPFTGTYTLASDIVADLEPLGGNSKITEVGVWDAASQSRVRYYYSAGSWIGTDFTISPGAGVYLIITSSFVWTPSLVTPTVP